MGTGGRVTVTPRGVRSGRVRLARPTARDLQVQGIRVGLVMAFLVLWQVASEQRWIDPLFVSKPTAVLQDLWRIVRGGMVFPHAAVTLYEVLIGLAAGAALGMGSGLLLAAFPFWRRVLDPILFAVYSTPRIALAPLFILWFGLGPMSKVVFAFSLVYFVMLFNTLAGLASVDRATLNAVRVIGATRSQMLVKVTLPSITPWVLAGMKSSLGLAFLGAIVGEFVGGTQGLGWMINQAAGLFQTARVLSSLVVILAMVVALNAVLNLIEMRVLRWRPDRGRL